MEEDKSKSQITSENKFVGFVLLGLGILFFLTNWGIIPSLHRTWPLILVVVGLAFLLGLAGKEKSSKEISSSEEESKQE